MNDLLSLLLTLRPMQAGEPGKRAWWGRAAQALLLHTAGQYDPALEKRLHEANEQHPFSVSSLIGPQRGGRLDPEKTYNLRLTALSGELAAILGQAASDGPLAPGQVVELDYQAFRIEAVQPAAAADETQDASPWARAGSYAGLSATLLPDHRPPERRMRLLLTSPTTFKSAGGMFLPLPLPELVFGSLLARWNAFAPLAFPPEARRYAAECLAINRYNLRTRDAPLKAGGVRIGAVGMVSFVSLNYDRYWMSVLHTLADFALYSGVGVGTGMGLGQCRVMEAEERQAGDSPQE